MPLRFKMGIPFFTVIPDFEGLNGLSPEKFLDIWFCNSREP